MNTPLYPNGITGLSDTKWSGSQGNAYKLVGVDFRSQPGIIKAHQKLKKISGTTVTELCKNVVDVSDGSKLWFSSESGKIWRQVGDTFTLIHTVAPVTDYKEPNSIVDGVFDESEKENGITMSIAENDVVYGTFTATSYAIDATKGLYNSVINLDNSYCVLAYSGTDNDGYIQSFNFSSTGAYSAVDSLEHDTYNGRFNSICKIDSTHFMVAYNGEASQNGIIKVFSGPTVLAQVSTLTHDSTVTGSGYNSLVQIDATHYALAYSGGASHYGYIKIFTIDGSYNITETKQLIHDSSGMTFGHKLVKIDSTHFILAYCNAATANIIKTFSIDGSYNITEIDSLTNASNGDIYQALIQVDATHYAWSGMIGTRGYVKVFTIDGSFEITETFDKDLGIYNYCPDLILTDETHVILASASSTTGYLKSFEVNSSFELTELSSYDFSSLSTEDISMARIGRRIALIYSDNSSDKNYLASTIMNETYANGIVLNPSGTSEIKLIASKIKSQSSIATQYLKETIKIPTGYSNLDIVVIAGRAGAETYNPVGVTVNGSAMTQVVNRTSTYGFKCSSAFFNYINPSTGDNEIIVDFGTAGVSYDYMAILVFKNVHQTTAYSSTIFDYGWQDYLEMPGTSNNQLRIGSFLSKISTHYNGELQDAIATNDIADDNDRYTISVSCRNYNIGTAKILSASEFSYTQSEVIATEDEEYKPEEQIQKIYYTNENVLFAVPVDKITDWANNIETIGVFKNGDDTYHSMKEQNLELFIGDKIVVAKVDFNGEFVQQTKMNISEPERIQVLSNFDTDLLIGTKKINSARVLRWDTFSSSWYADDDIPETGINAFIKDDNYTYVSAGDFGRLYFYNGEKLSVQKRISGTWDSTHKAIINENSVGYYMGNPVFGLSNSTGNPTEQGIYGYGNFDDKYVKSLSLDFPLSSGEFSGISIGAISINGENMYVSYKTATDVGIDKIDHSNKYTPAYIETMMLTALDERSHETLIDGICADYVSLPTSTSVSIGLKTKYDTDYTTVDVVVDPDTMSIKTKSKIPKVVNLQTKISLISNANNSPEIENIGIL